MNLVVIGTGYVGLVTGVGFSELGHKVSFIDLDEEKVDNLSNKKIPFYEPNLEDYFQNDENFNRMSFYSSYSDLEWESPDIVFICVQTPNNSATNSGDTKFFESAMSEISQLDNDNITITVKSTIPPYEIANVCNNVGYDKNLLTVNPEFLREGVAIGDFMNPDRVVIGGFDKQSTMQVKSLYDSHFDTDFILTDTTTAEMMEVCE